MSQIPSQRTADTIRQELSAASSEASPQMLLRTLLLGGGVGATMAGLHSLAKTIGRAEPRSFTYTQPTPIQVYTPSGAKKDTKKRRRKTRKAAGGYFSDLGSVINEPGDMISHGLVGGLGLYGGFKGVEAITKSLNAAVRKRQLYRARNELETALKELAVDSEAPQKKKASDLSEIDRLAINCSKLATGGTWERMKPWLAMLLAAPPAIGAGIGYMHGMQNNRRKDLEYAERRTNWERERLTPTVPIASLVDDKKEKTEQDDDAARRQLMQAISEEYDYL